MKGNVKAHPFTLRCHLAQVTARGVKEGTSKFVEKYYRYTAYSEAKNKPFYLFLFGIHFSPKFLKILCGKHYLLSDSL